MIEGLAIGFKINKALTVTLTVPVVVQPKLVPTTV